MAKLHILPDMDNNKEIALKGFHKVYAASRHEWRTWLSENHQEMRGVWLVLFNKKSAKPTITWSEAVDEALCFGWIDSIKKKLDDDCAVQFFSKRKPTSTWSRINKDKVNQLIKKGLMAPAGLKCIEIAKQNGSWTTLDEVEELIVPDDLAVAFRLHSGARNYFDSLSKSTRKAALAWVALAKRPETRQKRIDEIAVSAGKQMKPKSI